LVVTVEAHRHRLSVEHLFLELLLDQPLKLALGRRTLPGKAKPFHQVLDHSGGDDDPLLVRPSLSPPA